MSKQTEPHKDMPRCRTCKHWTGVPSSGLWGSCGRMRTEDDVDQPGTLAAARDHDGYMAFASTSPEFGCVMHEPATGDEPSQ